MCFFRFLLCGFVFVVDKILVLVFFFCSIGCSVILLHYIYISSCVSICCYFVPIFVFLFCCYLKLFHNVHEFCTLAIFFTITNKYWNSTIIIYLYLWDIHSEVLFFCLFPPLVRFSFIVLDLNVTKAYEILTIFPVLIQILNVCKFLLS
jgi:hypothetical protein